MMLYIGNLAKGDKANDLLEILSSYSNHLKIKIIRLNNKYTTLYHGLVDIGSDRKARKAMRILSSIRFNGRYLTVREYIHRASNSDRRDIGWRQRQWSNYDRRMHERRNRWESTVIDSCENNAQGLPFFKKLIRSVG